ncbi:MAG: DUF421 domain-containing protein [Clostridiales bacterium]|jgi:uncharacterized membrane protein YcaP (DUF421 family)|nr:DUF421 domain-containing protein [Clostridiales bacterium]
MIKKMNDLIFLILKSLGFTFIIYFVTLLLCRILGSKLVSQMTSFDFVLGIMMGSAAVNSTTFEENPALSAFVMLVGISIITLLIDLAHLKSIRFRKFIDAEPVIIIENGKIQNEKMKKLRLTVEDLMMMLRRNGYFNISDVQNAILESDGQLSVQIKPEKQPLTPSDINLTPPYIGLARDLIIDGKILDNNLSYINKDERWLKKQLLSYGVHDLADVFYVGIDPSFNFYVSKRQKLNVEPGKQGLE